MCNGGVGESAHRWGTKEEREGDFDTGNEFTQVSQRHTESANRRASHDETTGRIVYASHIVRVTVQAELLGGYKRTYM